jgi:hypothetical protein
MEVRAIEYQPETGFGWSHLSDAQRTSGNFSVWRGQPERPIETPDDLRSLLPPQVRFDQKSGETLRLTFGTVEPRDADELAAWLRVIFAGLDNPEEMAKALCSPNNTDLVFLSLPGERYRQLFRLHVAVPRFTPSDGTLCWYQGTITVLERALLVLWHSSQDAGIDVCSSIDSMARSGTYSGHETMPVADLASAYAREVAHRIRDIAEEATRFVDQWEAKLFAFPGERSGESDLRLLGNARVSTSALRSSLDRLIVQIKPGLWRFGWSTEDFPGIDKAVDESIEGANAVVSQLRSDVSDAFVAAGTIAISEQLRLSHAQDARTDRLQATVALLTAFLLVPALVATLFGPTVQLRLPGSPAEQALEMGALMVVGAVITYALLRRRMKHG